MQKVPSEMHSQTQKAINLHSSNTTPSLMLNYDIFILIVSLNLSLFFQIWFLTQQKEGLS